MASTMRDAGEFLRRDDVAKSYAGGKGPRVEFVSVMGQLTDPTQEFFLYNVAHANTAIRSPDGKAWIRALGFFPNKVATQLHANALLKHDPGLELRYFPATKFFCISRNKYADVFEEVIEMGPDGAPIVLADGSLKTRRERTFFDQKMRDAEIKKQNRLVKHHTKMRKQQIKEVKSNALRRRMGDSDETLQQQLAADTEGDSAHNNADAAANEKARRTLDDEEASALLRAGLTDLSQPLSFVGSSIGSSIVPSMSSTALASEIATDVASKNVSEGISQVVPGVKDAGSASETKQKKPLTHQTQTHTQTQTQTQTRRAFGAVKPIPRAHEIRMQRFCVIAVVDDYLTLREHEQHVNAWCARRDAAYNAQREALLWDVLEAHGRLRKSAHSQELLRFDEANTLDRATPQNEEATAAAFASAQEAALGAGRSALEAKTAGDLAASNAGGRPSLSATANEARAAGLTLPDVLPPLHKLIRKWLTNNPPPHGFNVWGEYIGKDASLQNGGLGFLKIRRDDVLAKRATFLPPRKADHAKEENKDEKDKEDKEDDKEDTEDNDLIAPASLERELSVWLQQRDMRVEEQTWRWAGHHEMPSRKDILAEWYKNPDNAPPDLNALPQEEPAVAGFRAFDSEENTRKWVKSMEKAHELKDFDLAAVAMYEWIRLEDRNHENLPRNYRNQHVHDIMTSKTEQEARARELELEARLMKRKLNVLTVSNNAVTATQELPSGLSAAEHDAAAAAAARADAETQAEIEAEGRAAAEGKQYTSSKLHTVALAKHTKDITGGPSASSGIKANEAEANEAETNEAETNDEPASASASASAGGANNARKLGKTGKGKGKPANAFAITKAKQNKVDADALAAMDIGTFKPQ